jgi:prepilin peptidase CpaA
VIALIASITDIRSRKVPNWLTFPGALIGILCRWWQFGFGTTAGLASGVKGWLLALGIMLATRILSYILGRGGAKAPVGFGDIKLMAALGACLGPRMFLCQLIVFAVLYVCFGLLKLVTSKTAIAQTLKTQLPLAPVMALATICSIFFYQPLSSMLGL